MPWIMAWITFKGVDKALDTILKKGIKSCNTSRARDKVLDNF